MKCDKCNKEKEVTEQYDERFQEYFNICNKCTKTLNTGKVKA